MPLLLKRTKQKSKGKGKQAVDVGAADDYHKKLRSHMAIGHPKVSQKPDNKKDNNKVPFANKNKDRELSGIGKGKDNAVVDEVAGKTIKNAKGDATIATVGKDNKKSASRGCPQLLKVKLVLLMIIIVPLANKKVGRELPSIGNGKDDDVAARVVDGVVGKATENTKGYSGFTNTGKDNEKSTSGVPLITEGDASATDDDYRKKLRSHSAIENVKCNAIVDQVDAKI
ncbi:hypothetical protein Q3G72_033663 [Acer saccharum]|nr:hypothetical protein Q3G72_033663 [Acer saccharum]